MGGAFGGDPEGRAVAHTSGAAGDPAQADLLAEAEAFAGELSLFEGSDLPPPKRGPGRPPGSPNRATLALKRLLLAKGYRDPAEFLAAIVSSDVKELARAAGIEGLKGRIELVKLRVRAAEALMPYFHQRMPLAVEHSGDGRRPVIIINDGGFGGLARRAFDGAAMSAHEVEQDQGLSAEAGAASDAEAQASDG